MADLFVSYSSVDGQQAALKLADALVAGSPSHPVWIDHWNLHPGLEDWDDQIDEALRSCRAVLFVMTADSVTTTSECKNEWVRALVYKRPIVPLQFDPSALLPFRLSSRQYVDFTGRFEVGLARLRQHLAWLDSPEGVLAELRARLADARRELPRALADRRARVQADIDELEGRVQDQQAVVADPDGARVAAERRISAGLARQQKPAEPVAAPTSRFVNAPPMVAPSWFQDRAPESALIGRFIADEGLRLLTVTGRGGVGKTALVCRVLRSLEGGQLPDEGGALSVAGIVYLGRAGTQAVSFARLFEDLCSLLAPDVAQRLRARYRDGAESPASLAAALAEAFASGPVVVLVDNFDDIVDATSESITDSAMGQALRGLLEAPAHGLKVIITTRVAPADLALVQPARQWRLGLDQGLESPHAERLLRRLDADGSLGMRDASDDLLGLARERTRGYPRALEAIKAILVADRGLTLAELLERPVAPDHVVEVLVGEAFDRLDALARRVMQALAVFTTPVPAVAVDYLLQPDESAIDSAPVLRRLVNAGFAHRDQGRYYLHPVDRTYALGRLPQGGSTPGAGTELNQLRQRAAGYFASIRTPRQSWRSVEDLVPQLAEFDMRCQAQDYGEAETVLASIDFDHLFQWGHYRYLLELGQRLDGHLEDPRQQSYRLGILGNCHLFLGDYRRAIELYEQGLAITRQIGDRSGEGRHLGNLGLYHHDLGDYRRAIELYEQALAIAGQIGDRRGEGTRLGNVGNCHFVLGDYRRAIEMYEQALAITRQIGDRSGEGVALGNLGTCHHALGDYRRAIELHEQALALARQIGDPYVETMALTYLGDALRALGELSQAEQAYDTAIGIADTIANLEPQVEARCGLAETHLLTGDLQAAQAVLGRLGPLDYPPRRALIQLTGGLACFLSGDPEHAREAFSASIDQADDRLRLAGGEVASWDVMGLAYAGLAALGDEDCVHKAITAFRNARAIATTPGLVDRVLALLHLLSPFDPEEILDAVRAAASGR